MNTRLLRARMSETVDRVSERLERVIVTRRGKPVAAVVSLSDLDLLCAWDAYSRVKIRKRPA